jgi:hypothetical protein
MFKIFFGISAYKYSPSFLASFYGLKYFLFYNKLDFSNSIATTEENHRLHSEPEISPEVRPKTRCSYGNSLRISCKTSLFSNKNDSQNQNKWFSNCDFLYIPPTASANLLCLNDFHNSFLILQKM